MRIPRPRLAERISRALDAGAVVLEAGAGFGKTTALDEAIRLRGARAAWVSCAQAERDAGRLLAAIVAAVRRAAPGGADALADRLAVAAEPADVPGERLTLGKPVDASAAIAELAVELGERLVDPLVLVLDDAERLAGSASALALLERLLREHAPPLRVAVATRRPLSLRVAKLAAAGRLEELRAADLAFDAGECAGYLLARHGAEPDQGLLEQVMAASEGWPLGVALGALAPAGAPAGYDGDAPQQPRHRLRSRRELDAFLAEEVLDPLEPEWRAMVIDSSVPRELGPETVAALGLPDGFVDEIGRLGLVLRPTGPRRGAVGYHPILREFLLARLDAERDPAHRRELHARVAPAVAAAGHPIEAIEHWLAAEAWPEALAALAREGAALVRTVPESVRAWIERLPSKAREDPAVCLLEGLLAGGVADFERAADLLRAAVAGCARRDDPAGEWRARFWLCDALFSLGAFAEAERLAEGFDDPAAAAAGPFAPATAVHAATCLAADGSLEASAALAGRALEHPEAADLAPLESLRRALLDAPAGRGDEALRRIPAAIDAVERSDPLARAPHLMATMALVLGDQGHADAALGWWHRVEEAVERGGAAPFLVGASRVHRALLHAQAGRLEDAELELAGAEPIPRAGWRAHHVEVARAAVAALRGDAPAAVASAEAAITVAARAPIAFRSWAGADLVAVLGQVGQCAAAHRTLEATMAAVDEKLPGGACAYLGARLHALRAGLRAGEGDAARADEDLRRLWALAGDGAAHVVRREWPRLEAVLWGALERGALDPDETVRTIATAWPDGAPLIAFTEHPVGAVRAAALSPAVASGHPRALHGLRRLAEDPDPSVVARARAAAAGLAAVAPPLVVNLLGGFVVRRGPWTVDDEAWERPMDARLVRFLAVHRDALIPEDLLFEAFWPDSSLAAARRGLQVAVSRARAVLDPPGAEASVIEAAGRAYRLRLEDHAIVDVDEFERMADGALAERGRPRRAMLERARALWGGEPLPEDRYAEWSVAWRERLVDRYIDVLGALAEAAAAEDDHAAAIQSAREVVDLDPVNEGAHRELMAAYARAGRRGHALRQYLECRRALIDELGVEPSEATSRLQARILAGEPVRAPGAPLAG